MLIVMSGNALRAINVDEVLREYEEWFLNAKDMMLQKDVKIFFMDSVASLIDLVDDPENVFNGLFPKFLEIEKGLDKKIVETIFFNALFKVFQEKAKRSIKFKMCFKKLISNTVNGIYIKWREGKGIDKRELMEEAELCVYLISKLIPYVGIYFIGLGDEDYTLISRCKGNKLLCLSVLSSMKGFLAFIYLKSQLLRDERFKDFFVRNVFSEAEALHVFRDVVNMLKDDGKIAVKMAIFIDNFLPKLWEMI